MAKKIALRMIGGAGAGILIGHLVTIIINILLSEGEYLPIMPALEDRCRDQMQAVLMQMLLTALIGIVFAEAGMIFEIERWSFLKQMAVHFCVTAPFYLSFAALCWLDLHWGGYLGIAASAVVTYFITFWVNYRLRCRDVQQINEMVRGQRRETENA